MKHICSNCGDEVYLVQEFAGVEEDEGKSIFLCEECLQDSE